MDNGDIGYNAGAIWNLLADKGSLNIRKIGELTGNSKESIFLALGWLAREDKIRLIEENIEEDFCVELKHFNSEIYY
jgi:Protein of unknown function (DUF2582).